MRRLQPTFQAPRAVRLLGAAGALLAGGCSADIARFDFATASLGGEPAAREQAGLTEAAPAGRESPGGAYYPAPSTRTSVERGELTPPLGSEQPPAVARPYSSAPAARPYEPAPQRVAAATPPAEEDRGEMIEVQRGDTLYGLARRHQVSVNDLTRLNDIQGHALKPGQKLYLPRTAAARRAPVAAPEVAAAPTSVDAPADWTGSYTVKSGDSLYAVARRHGVKLADLERYNGIADARRVKPGTTLKVPGDGTQPAAAPAVVAEAKPSPTPQWSTTAPADAGGAASGAPEQPRILNSRDPKPAEGQRYANLDNPGSTTDATPTATATPVATSVPAQGSVAGSKLRWPVTGKVVSAFGPRTDGTHNDGVNVAVPMGTDIHAAEAGVVAYAGNELKGYGNLVLLRHDNGWVTAYAHADELAVKRGDRIRRGQVIGKAGRTGNVDQPQVHFELRQGQRPVDPTPFMERL